MWFIVRNRIIVDIDRIQSVILKKKKTKIQKKKPFEKIQSAPKQRALLV